MSSDQVIYFYRLTITKTRQNEFFLILPCFIILYCQLFQACAECIRFRIFIYEKQSDRQINSADITVLISGSQACARLKTISNIIRFVGIKVLF